MNTKNKPVKVDLAAHVPTPWEIRIPYPITIAEKKSNIGRHTILLKEVGGDLQNILQCYDTSTHRAADNAAFIVRAVNSHEALLEAAKRVTRMHTQGFLTTQDIVDLNEAIAQAEGEVKP